MAKKTLVAKHVPADKVDAFIKALQTPPAATGIKKTKNDDGTFDVEATVVVDDKKKNDNADE